MSQRSPAPRRNAQAVLFDVGATLVDPHPSAQELVLQVIRGHGFDVGSDDLARAEPQAWAAVADLLPFQRYGQDESNAFWDRFYRALLQALGLPPDAGLGQKLYEAFQRLENWRLYPEVVPVLTELRVRGYRLAVVSNWEEWLEELLLALEVHRFFEVIVASGPFGRAKPDPSIFQSALELLGVSPDRAVHVGDNPRDDVAGARLAGVRPILIDRRGRHGQLEVERIDSLASLLELLA